MKALAAARQSLKRISEAWTEFWFAPQDPLSLGVARWLVGGMMLYAHFVWGLNLDGFFGPEGWQSLEAINGYFADSWLPSLWWHVPAEHLRLVHVLCFIPLVMFVLGLASPVTSVLALAITISNSNRAPLANYGMDQILSMLALYLVIGGAGDRLSVDSWIRRRRTIARTRGQGDQETRGGRHDASTPRPLVPLSPCLRLTSRARLGTRLIQVHYCVIYFFAGISKLQGDAWWNGEAVWMAFANQEYQSIDMTWLAHYPWVTQLATHVTILFELSFAFVIWNRWLRPVLLAIGLGIHLGIGLCMGMITFGAIMIFGYMAFVPPEWVQRGMDVISRRKGTTDHGPRTTDLLEPSVVRDPSSTEDETIVHSEIVHPPSRPQGDRQTQPCRTAQIAICDPEWRHREFAHYLQRRGFQPFMTETPTRMWRHVEQHDLQGAVLFVDRLDDTEYDLLLQDLSLSPICDLPVVIASQRERRVEAARTFDGRHVDVVQLPASFRDIRVALEGVVKPAAGNRHVTPSVNGHAKAQKWTTPTTESTHSTPT